VDNGDGRRRTVALRDLTLREGLDTPGVNFSASQAVRIGTMLAAAGIREAEIVAPARDWTMGDEDLASFVRARRLPVTATSAPDCQIDQNLWGRIVVWTSPEAPTVIRARASRHRLNESATIDLHFEHGTPTSVNGVPMSPAELVECLALIGGQHGIGQTVVSAQGRQVLYDAPAATVLQIAASVAGQHATADVCLKLGDGEYTVLSPRDRHALLVNA